MTKTTKKMSEAVAKIACTKCDEVSTQKAWEKNDGFCPKCKNSTQGVAESNSFKTAFKKHEELRQRAIKRARAWMKRTGKDEKAAAKEFDIRVNDLTESNVSYASDLDDSKPVRIKGTKHSTGKAFSKKFRNMDAYSKWTDTDAADDVDVKQIANESVNEHKMMNEGVLDDMDDAGFMAKRQLYDIAKHAVELHRAIQDTDELEPWIQAKITQAADYIDTVKEYIDYRDVRSAEATADVAAAPDIADIDSVVTTLDAPIEEDYEDEEDGATIEGHDVLFWASRRGIISLDQYNAPSPELENLADETAMGIGTVYEVGSSDISIWLRSFVRDAQNAGVALEGRKAHAYVTEQAARKIYKNMLSSLKGKK